MGDFVELSLVHVLWWMFYDSICVGVILLVIVVIWVNRCSVIDKVCILVLFWLRLMVNFYELFFLWRFCLIEVCIIISCLSVLVDILGFGVWYVSILKFSGYMIRVGYVKCNG